MQRYFIETATPNEPRIVIGAPHYHHLVNVMRHEVGDECIVVFNDRNSFIATLVTIMKTEALVQLTTKLEKTAELPIEVTLACGLPKGDKLELIVQKSTELGAFAIQPYVAERSIVKWDDKKQAKKRQRLQKIAQEAAEQSHRIQVPEIKALLTTKQLAAAANQYTHLFVADEEEAKINESQAYKALLRKIPVGSRLLIIFGPEGGLSRTEVDLFCQNGAISGSFGPRILRTETAPLYAMAAISYEFEL